MIADEELVREWQQGSAGALEALVQRHHGPLLAHLARLTGDAHVAEDLTQETFVQVWRHLATFQGRGSLRSWLHRIARREFLDWLQRPQAVLGLDGIADVAALEATVWMEGVELRACIHRLPLEEREVVLLHHLEGYTSSEIAPIVGAPARTVRLRLAQARERLARELAPGRALPNPAPSRVPLSESADA
jgi:RNA polymerase sigma-70 factor (ECF subfamily)